MNSARSGPAGAGVPQLRPFEAFDKTWAEELRREPPKEIEASLSRISNLIDALPQRPAIQDRDKERWIHRTMITCGDRLEADPGEGNFTIADVHRQVLWHVRRASGIGGSEIGMLVRHFRGETGGGFGSARNLVLEKLLVLSPMPPTPAMARGNRAEPWIRRIFHEKHGVVSDQPSLLRLRDFRWDRTPHLAGNPDDIVRPAAAPEGTALSLVDYKSPSADVCAEYESTGIAFDYVCQVHHYALLAMGSGLRLESLSVQVFDPRHFDLTAYPVPFDKDLAKEILSAAGRIWTDHVMPGVLPDHPGLEEIRTDDPVMVDIGHQAAMLRVLRDVVEAREKECLSRLVEIGTRGADRVSGRILLGPATLSRTRSWDEEALREWSAAAGVDVSGFEERTDRFDAARAQRMLQDLLDAIADGDPSRILDEIAAEGLPVTARLDADALAARLEDMGVDVSGAERFKDSFLLTRKSKGPDAEALRRLKDQAHELMEAIDDVVEETASRIIAGDPVEPAPGHEEPV